MQFNNLRWKAPLPFVEKLLWKNRIFRALYTLQSYELYNETIQSGFSSIVKSRKYVFNVCKKMPKYVQKNIIFPKFVFLNIILWILWYNVFKEKMSSPHIVDIFIKYMYIFLKKYVNDLHIIQIIAEILICLKNRNVQQCEIIFWNFCDLWVKNKYISALRSSLTAVHC